MKLPHFSSALPTFNGGYHFHFNHFIIKKSITVYPHPFLETVSGISDNEVVMIDIKLQDRVIG